MLHTQLKQGLRLNRTLAFSMLAFGVLLALVSCLSPLSVEQSFWAWARIGGLLGITMLFLLMNEAALRAFKRLNLSGTPRSDDLFLEKLSLLVPLSVVAYLALAYLLTGQFAVLLLWLTPPLQACLFGHRALAWGISLLLGLLAWISCLFLGPWGYPALDPIALAHSTALFPLKEAPLGFGVRILLCLLPLAWTLHHYGGIVAASVQTASSRVSRLQSLATIDGLTGLVNRRQFNHRLDAEIACARRHRSPLSLALFDIDDFKKINDLYGHPIGDRILGELGRLILANMRESDISARYGGEEFALILPETSCGDAYELLERLRALIEGSVFCLPDNPMTVTVSVGVAQMDEERIRAYELIGSADAALYDAKKQGKNRVIPAKGVLTPSLAKLG